jgi:hypothetical protein
MVNNRNEALNQAKQMTEGLKGMMGSVTGLLNSLTKDLPKHEQQKIAKLMKDKDVKSHVDKAKKDLENIQELFDLKK